MYRILLFLCTTFTLFASNKNYDIIILCHGQRVDDKSAKHLFGHQAVLIGSEEKGWKYYSYDFDEGQNVGKRDDVVNDNFTSGLYFESLAIFRESEHNTFKDDYDDGKGLETAHLGSNGKIVQRYSHAYWIVTDSAKDVRMERGAARTFLKPYSILTGNQCTRVPKNALKAAKLKTGENSYRFFHLFNKIHIPYRIRINFLPMDKQTEIEKRNKGCEIDELIDRKDK